MSHTTHHQPGHGHGHGHGRKHGHGHGHGHHPPGDGAEAGTSPPRGGLMMLLLCLAQFMVILDVTVVNIALPEIGRALELSRAELTWVATSYILTFGGLLILGGRLADAIGRRATFLAGLALFTVASLTCGLAISGPMLLTSRVAQGVGAALLSPSALSILTTEFTGRDRHKALGIWAGIGGVGAAVGVIVGGALTSGPGWEWAFLINAPIGIVVAVAVPSVVPARPRQGSTRVDIPGALAGTATVALFIYALIRAGDSGWTSASTLVPAAAAVLCGIVFVVIERATAVPLVPLPMLRRPPLPGPLAVMLGVSAMMLAGFFLISLYLQQVRGFSAIGTGLLFLPVALGTGFGAHLAAGMVSKVGARPVAAVGMALAAVGYGVLGWVGVDADSNVYLTLLPAFVVAALGLGAGIVTATVSALTRVDHHHAGLASGILNTGHELGGSLGLAVVSTIAAASIAGTAAQPAEGFSSAILFAAGFAIVLGVAAVTVFLPRGLPPAADGPMILH